MTKAVTLPMWAAKMMGVVIEKIGPKGLEYARFSIDLTSRELLVCKAQSSREIRVPRSRVCQADCWAV
jgi:hypothetical protein